MGNAFRSSLLWQVVFLKVDVDEALEVAQEYEISAMPTFVLVKEAKKARIYPTPGRFIMCSQKLCMTYKCIYEVNTVFS